MVQKYAGIIKGMLFITCREAHLWCVKPDELKDASILQEYMKILSPCEKENVLSIKGEVLQKCALLSRVLVRTTLSRCMLDFLHVIYLF